jgi:hypothetical protein
MKTQFVKAGEAVEKGETLALQLERSRRELDVCRRQLAQMKRSRPSIGMGREAAL